MAEVIIQSGRRCRFGAAQVAPTSTVGVWVVIGDLDGELYFGMLSHGHGIGFGADAQRLYLTAQDGDLDYLHVGDVFTHDGSGAPSQQLPDWSFSLFHVHQTHQASPHPTRLPRLTPQDANRVVAVSSRGYIYGTLDSTDTTSGHQVSIQHNQRGHVIEGDSGMAVFQWSGQAYSLIGIEYAASQDKLWAHPIDALFAAMKGKILALSQGFGSKRDRAARILTAWNQHGIRYGTVVIG